MLLSKDIPIANIIDGTLEPILPGRLPLFLQRTGDVDAWLASRAVNSERTNVRLLKRALRLEKKDDISTVLSVNAAKITDNYWVKPLDDKETKYADIRFTANPFADLALTGDVNSFAQPPSRTPELTNSDIFSSERCWKLQDGAWWMIKACYDVSLFGDMFTCNLGKALGFPMADYQPYGRFIQYRDFTDQGSVDYESAAAIIAHELEISWGCEWERDDINYVVIYEFLKQFGKNVCDDYVKKCYLDALVLNEYQYDFGLLRDSDTGEVLRFAPNYSHDCMVVGNYVYHGNSGGIYDASLENFNALLQHIGEPFSVPKLPRQVIQKCMNNIPWELPLDKCSPGVMEMEPKRFVTEHLVKRQAQLEEQNRGLLILKPPIRAREQAR